MEKIEIIMVWKRDRWGEREEGRYPKVSGRVLN